MKSKPRRVDEDQKKNIVQQKKGDGEMSDTKTLRELAKKKVRD